MENQELTFEQLFNDLVAAERTRKPPDNSFTVRDFAQASQLTYSTAARRLQRRAENKELETDVFLYGRNETRFYWFPD